MLLGITTFGKKISPRFDCALGLLMVEIERNEILDRKEESMEGIPGGERVSFLVELGVQAIITGGMRRSDYLAALDAGLKVHAGFMGEVEENLRRYLYGTFPRFGPGMNLSPGNGNRKMTRDCLHGKGVDGGFFKRKGG